MSNRNVFVFTAVVIFLLILLIACGGGAVSDEAEITEDTTAEEEIGEDVEATGSESDSKDILPTPVTGAKVSATRVSGLIQLDLFFLVQTANSESITLESVSEWLAGQAPPVEAQFAIGYLGEATTDEANFSSDFGAVTTFLTQPSNESVPTEAVGEGLDQIMQLADWRVDADHLLFVFITKEEISISDDELSLVAETAVSNAIAIYPFLVGEMSLETQQSWQQLAEASNGRLAQIAVSAPTAETWAAELIQSLDHALAN